MLFLPDMTGLQSQAGLTWPDQLLHEDFKLLFRINRDWQHPMLDTFFLFYRESLAHAPVYLFLVMYAVLNHGKKGWLWVLTAVAMVSFNDFVSSQVIKAYFDRPRPCRDPILSEHVRFIARHCGLNGSFISSHASNHFALAAFVWRSFRHKGRGWSILFLWATLVAYAQVYVGVHYPSDVVCGALFGVGIGLMAARFFERRIGLQNIAA
jgi:membrane-associated phospholipid phosphatase